MQVTEMHQQSMNQLGEHLARLEPQPQSTLRSSRYQGILSTNLAQGGARKKNPGAPNLGPGPQWRHVGSGRSSELGKPYIGNPGRAKNAENSMGGAEPAVQSGPESVPWTPKGSR